MSPISIDLNTLLVVTVANIVLLAIVSLAVMGRQISVAARSARWSLLLHAASWISMILSNLWPETFADRVLSTLSVGGFAASNWMLFKALSYWLGPRRFYRTSILLMYIIPIGYFCYLGIMPLGLDGPIFYLQPKRCLSHSHAFNQLTLCMGSGDGLLRLA